MPKELISRFVKLCPTCQVRRGTSRNSPPESVKSPEATTEVQSPETYSATTSRKNSTASGHTTSASMSLQRVGYKTTPIFQQQNRWMTPLQPLTESNNISPTSTLNPISRHDSYSTMPPMPMSCTNGNPPGLSFSAVNTYGITNGTSSAYNSSSVSRSGHGNVAPGTTYDGKVDSHYL